MIVFRLAKKPYHLDLSGKGAELYGGRWNSKGIAVLYTSDSRALCFAEIAMHLPLGIIPKDYFLTSIFIHDQASIKTLKIKDLPSDWRSNPHSSSTQQIGDDFIKENRYLALKVPSAVVPGDFNYLLNPAHPEFLKIKIRETEAFEFDSRIGQPGMPAGNKSAKAGS